MLKGFKVRLLPTEQQERIFIDKLNAVRFVWNWGLAEQMQSYKTSEKHLSSYELRDRLRELKNNHDSFGWLQAMGATILTTPLFDLDKA